MNKLDPRHQRGWCSASPMGTTKSRIKDVCNWKQDAAAVPDMVSMTHVFLQKTVATRMCLCDKSSMWPQTEALLQESAMFAEIPFSQFNSKLLPHMFVSSSDNGVFSVSRFPPVPVLPELSCPTSIRSGLNYSCQLHSACNARLIV